MRVLALSMVFAVLVVGCGGRGGSSHGPSAEVGAYPALRWVPADVTYVVTARRATDWVAAVRELIDLFGVGADLDATTAQGAMRSALGFDTLSAEGLAEIGVAPGGSLALFSRGVSPTFAVQLADPAKMSATIDRLRSGGVAVQASQQGGVEVYAFRPHRDIGLHWAIADGWLWFHVELGFEKEAEGAWFTALRGAGGALAAHADWKAALAAGKRLPAGGTSSEPPVVGLARLPALASALAPSGAPDGCLALPRAAGRAFLAAGVAGPDAGGALTIELGASAPQVAALALPPMAGWIAAREGAPVQGEWALDLLRVSAAVAPCDGGELARGHQELGIRALRGFVHAIDLDNLGGRAAVHLDLSSKRVFAELLGEIPGRSFLERKKRVGPYDGAELSVPMFPSVTYVLTDAILLAGVGLDLAAAVGSGPAAPSSQVAHLSVTPGGLSAPTWEALFEAAGMGTEERRRAVTRLQRWAQGQIDLALAGGELVLTAKTRRVR